MGIRESISIQIEYGYFLREFLREDEATWYATNFNAASEESLDLVGRTPNLRLHSAAPQWQSWSAPNWTNLLRS